MEPHGRGASILVLELEREGRVGVSIAVGVAATAGQLSLGTVRSLDRRSIPTKDPAEAIG
jgi:hypothetical protein